VLKIVDILAEPIHEISYVNAKSGGGTESKRLELLRARVTGLDDRCRGIIVASDLQGFSASWYQPGGAVLLGNVLVEELEALAYDGVIPATKSLGVILAGDLYSIPGASKRGGFGDVSGVWSTFADAFRWVVGVAGNHDHFGNANSQAKLMAQPNVHLLHGETANVDGIRFGGVGYIAGNPRKPGRRSVQDQEAALDMVLETEPEVLILHEGPRGGSKQRGDQQIRARIERSQTALTICGHRHWDVPLAGTSTHQFLNTDSRALLLAS